MKFTPKDENFVLLDLRVCNISSYYIRTRAMKYGEFAVICSYCVGQMTFRITPHRQYMVDHRNFQ
jgi:hypothetical protein